MYKKIKENWDFEFNIADNGVYAISISATCQNGKFLGLFGGEDLRIEIDDTKPREVPAKSKPQYYNIPAAWNGTDLKGTEKTAIFILKLDKGKHVIRFIPKRGAQILKEPQISKLDDNLLLENIQSEEKDRQSWITVILFDLQLNFIDAEFTCSKRSVFDSDDVKIIIDGEIQKNDNSNWWGKNWLWQGRILQGKTQAKRFYLNLPKDNHCIEFWADEIPLLNRLNFTILGKTEENNDNENVKLKQYKAGLLGEDYNRLDAMILDVVEKWNSEFLNDVYPVENPLDPNLVKAMIYQESKVGYYKNKINVMQVGNPGDPSLKTLNGELTEYWIKNGKKIKLDYKGEAKVNSQYDSIYWGVRWLYHKAQENKNGQRYWRDWKEAVQKYGPGPERYVENVWSIYKNGVDKPEQKGPVKVWAMVLLAPLVFSWHNFLFQLKNNIFSVDIVKNKIIAEEKPEADYYLDDIEVNFSENNPANFFAITVWERDWWEEFKIGKMDNNNAKWLNIDYPVEQQYILDAKFINLKGFDDQMLEVYGKTHVGNGFIYLYKIEKDGVKLLLKTRAVDSKNELSNNPEYLKKYGYQQCDEVFRDGKLNSEYKDLNNDGFDDVVLSGTADIICEKERNEDIIVETYNIEKSFLWDKDENIFKESENMN